jgi:acylphosphatase
MIPKRHTVRIRVVYSGRVQGVGFRWQVNQVSEGFAVTGFVRNLEDGTVELLVEGDSSEVRGMIEAVEKKLKDFWNSKVADERAGDPHYEEFSIDYL